MPPRRSPSQLAPPPATQTTDLFPPPQLTNRDHHQPATTVVPRLLTSSADWNSSKSEPHHFLSSPDVLPDLLADISGLLRAQPCLLHRFTLARADHLPLPPTPSRCPEPRPVLPNLLADISGLLRAQPCLLHRFTLARADHLPLSPTPSRCPEPRPVHRSIIDPIWFRMLYVGRVEGLASSLTIGSTKCRFGPMGGAKSNADDRVLFTC
ncbi:hypothetical protein M0R45_037566 [Rubus argutus]|uniref:Uncharacterized protein n=1 Tax=Rubus argutus TaxID=59490 RepID=A0AAW1W0F8_RUBAR